MRDQRLSHLLSHADDAFKGADRLLISGADIRGLARRQVLRRNTLATACLLLIAGGISAISMGVRNGINPRNSNATAGIDQPSRPPASGPAIAMDVRERIALEAQIRLDHQRLAALCAE